MSNENLQAALLNNKEQFANIKIKNFTKKFKSQKVNVHKLLVEKENQNKSLLNKKKIIISFFLIVFSCLGLYSSFV
tara:strand:- start:1304 stop:1531 length:228 start_codon:yes stop_codon:yes gene_type:complete